MTNSRPNRASFSRFNLFFQGCLFLILTSSYISVASAWTCVYVSSYHKGYAWSDGIERGLRTELKGHCDLIQFNMDTKRNKSELYKIQKAREIAAKVKKIQPDVLIVSDDNAAKYLVVPYFRGGRIPVVFSGINWTVDEYGFPASNVTGMIEVAPVFPMLEWAQKLTAQGKKGLYIGANTLTETKFLKQVVKVATDMDMIIDGALVDTMDDWQNAYQQAAGADFIILGSPSGIVDWDINLAKEIVIKSAEKLILVNYDWMMPIAMLGFVEIPEEHGRWTAKTAIAIHGGLPIQRIPIITSRKWEVYENRQLLKLSGIKIPKVLRARAKKFTQGIDDGNK
ncbi:MAG: hypothetical protein U9N50_06070 [Pseudomonadota bacterium]|nr:hypothetical protein [Pseudomonadota bacterium]